MVDRNKGRVMHHDGQPVSGLTTGAFGFKLKGRNV